MGTNKKTLKFHHSGYFTGSGESVRCEGGLEDDVVINPDYLNRFQLVDVCKQLRYCNIRNIFYLVPLLSMNDSLRVDSDDATRDLSELLRMNEEVHVYIEHEIDVPDDIVGLI